MICEPHLRGHALFRVDNVTQLLAECPHEIRVRSVRRLVDVLVRVKVVEASGPVISAFDGVATTVPDSAEGMCQPTCGHTTRHRTAA